MGCNSKNQQNKLTKITDLGGVTIKCFTPEATTEGVVKGIPREHSENEILRMDIRVNIKSESGKTAQKGLAAIKKIVRLKNKKGDISEAIKITFRTAVLPDSVTLEGEELPLEAFACPVRRCGRCSRFGHSGPQCRAKTKTCARCGGRDHDVTGGCDQERHFVNCHGGHSAGYMGCPEYRVRLRANTIRSQSYIPYSEAMQRARKEIINEKQEKEEKHGTLPHK